MRVVTVRVRTFVPLMIACALMGGGGVVLFGWPGVERLLDAQAEVIARQSTQLADNAGATLIYDPGSAGGGVRQPGITTPLGKFTTGVLAAYIAVATPESPAPKEIRWYIPARVRPIVYGAANGAMVFYWDTKTQKLEGPYPPELGTIQ